MSETARPMPKGYEFVRVVGAGGCGEVVLARQTALSRLVAVKRIHGYALAAPDAVERFAREAKVLASIDHPAVVRVYDFRRRDTDATLVMEYVPGESLAELLDRGRPSVAEALVILGDVADALRVAAARGVVHRDIKPGNVFVLPSGRAKLGDFGLARIVADPSVFRTTTGEVSGTPAYFPPECGSASAEPDERSDAYSFAVMAYEVLTGRLPFTAPDVMALIAAHFATPPPPPETVVPGFPKAASAALLAGLAKDPGERVLPWDLVARLTAVKASAWPAVPAAAPAPPRRVAPADATVRAPSPVTPPAGLPATPRVPSARAGVRRRLPVLAGALGLVVVASVGAVLAVQALSSPSATPSAPPAALQVTGARVTVAPAAAVGRCPSARFTFTGVIDTNGRPGTVTVHWTRPDGRDTATTSLAAPTGAPTVTAVLNFDVTGQRPLRGRATLHVESPQQHDAPSAAVAYTC